MQKVLLYGNRIHLEAYKILSIDNEVRINNSMMLLMLFYLPS